MQLIRQIRALLYIDGFTISGARNKLNHDSEVAGKPLVSDDRSEIVSDLIRDIGEVVSMLRD